MTNTTLVNAQTLVPGYGVNATKTAFQTSTTGYTVSLTLEVSQWQGQDWPGFMNANVVFYAASSSVSVSAAQATAQFRKAAAYMDSAPPRFATTVTQNFPLLARLGDYVYVWLEVPNYPATVVATVTLWENA